MPHAKMTDRHYLEKQYKDASNVDVRISLHQRFSVNKVGWHPWVFDHFELPHRCRILELGCGPGYLWLDNLDRIPTGWEITLSDFSAGMLEATRRAAEEAILDHTVFAVSPKAYAEFLARLDAPPQPNERLRKALQTPAPWE